MWDTDEIPMRDTDERVFKHHRLASSGAPVEVKVPLLALQQAQWHPHTFAHLNGSMCFFFAFLQNV